jgi:hypothetical protein
MLEVNYYKDRKCQGWGEHLSAICIKGVSLETQLCGGDVVMIVC